MSRIRLLQPFISDRVSAEFDVQYVSFHIHLSFRLCPVMLTLWSERSERLGFRVSRGLVCESVRVREDLRSQR